jgi:exonuclease III
MRTQHDHYERTPQQTGRQTQSTIAISQTNLTANTPWGDKIAEKEDHILRIYAQNVNGIKIDADGGQYKEICNLAKEVQADIFCFQEHNLDTTQFKIRQILQNTTLKQWQRSRLVIASSPIEFAGYWKPGGTAILSNGHVTGRLTTVGQDKWGRSSYQTLLGQRGRKFTIISAYQVVAQKQSLKGLYTVAAQLHNLLIRQNDPITDPRKAFRRDLTVFIQQLKQENHGIVLLGDFNEQLGNDPSGMSRIASTCELLDLMKLQHPYLSEVATYARGRKRLDYILGSPEVAHAMEKSGYEPFNYRHHTDHRAYFVDVNTRILFGSSIQPLAKFTDRILHSNNLQQVTKYIQIKH